MSIARQEQYELEQRIFQLRNEAGAQAIREHIINCLDAINASWPDRTGDDLTRAQGQAKSFAVLLRIIDDGPKHKPVVPALKPNVEA